MRHHVRAGSALAEPKHCWYAGASVCLGHVCQSEARVRVGAPQRRRVSAEANGKVRETALMKVFTVHRPTHHGVVQHTQSVFADRQPHLALLHRGGGHRLWTGQTKTVSRYSCTPSCFTPQLDVWASVVQSP